MQWLIFSLQYKFLAKIVFNANVANFAGYTNRPGDLTVSNGTLKNAKKTTQISVHLRPKTKVHRATETQRKPSDSVFSWFKTNANIKTETLKVCFPFVNLRISKKTFRVFHERNVR